MVSVNSGNLRKVTLPMLILASAFAISACQSKTASLGDLDGLQTASTSPASFKKTAELGNRWQGDPKNIKVGLAYADGLEKLGQTQQQMQVLATLSDQNPQNFQIQSLYGKALIGAGRPGEAIPVLEKVAASGTQRGWHRVWICGLADHCRWQVTPPDRRPHSERGRFVTSRSEERRVGKECA